MASYPHDFRWETWVVIPRQCYRTPGSRDFICASHIPLSRALVIMTCLGSTYYSYVAIANRWSSTRRGHTQLPDMTLTVLSRIVVVPNKQVNARNCRALRWTPPRVSQRPDLYIISASSLATTALHAFRFGYDFSLYYIGLRTVATFAYGA